jgi:hypothetical protein
MDAKELRIGNYVYAKNYNYGNKYVEVESLSNYAINIDFRQYDIDEIEGIIVTKESLNEMDFPIGINIHSQISIDIDESGYFLIRSLTGTIRPRKIKYLHEWQNLYYDIFEEYVDININNLK